MLIDDRDILNNYQDLAEKTSGLRYCLYCALHKPETGGKRLLTAALGLVGEVIELYALKGTDDRVKEAGDVAWYIAEACSTLGLEMGNLPFSEEDTGTHPVPLIDLLFSAGAFSEIVKKVVSHDHPFDDTMMNNALGKVLTAWRRYCDEKGLMYNDVLNANIIKLKNRYGDKFSPEASLYRIE